MSLPRNENKMKKILLTIATALLGLSALAQDAILDKIEKANAGLTSVQCSFTEQKTLVATGRKFDFDGTVHFLAPDKMALRFNQPTELAIINGDTYYLKRGGKPMLVHTDKSPMMLGLRNTLLNCIQGRPRQVAAENDADIAVKETKDVYIVLLTARKQTTKGYAHIYLSYRKSDCALVKMDMEEFGGIIDIYQMSGHRFGVTHDPAVFEIPEK